MITCKKPSSPSGRTTPGAAEAVVSSATFGVLTTIAAFAPMMFVGGVVAPFFEAMAFVVILCLAFSLVESKLILPAHLAEAHIPPVDEDDLFNPQRPIGVFERIPRAFLKVQRHIQHGLQHLIHKVCGVALSGMRGEFVRMRQ